MHGTAFTKLAVRAGALHVLVAATLTGCGDPVAPRNPIPSEPFALVRLGGVPDLDHTHRLLRVGLRSRKILDWSEPIMFRIVGIALSPDGQSLYLTGSGADGWKESQIVALDTRTLQVRWREFLADSAGYRRDRFNGLAIETSHETDVSPDGTRIFTAGARDNTGWGVAALASDTRDAVGFAGPYPSGSMDLAIVPPGSFNEAGALAVTAGAPSGWPNIGPGIWLYDPETLEVIDSIDVSSDLAGADDGIANLLPAPDGVHLYLRLASGWLIKYDLIQKQVSASVYSPAPSCLRCLTLAPDGQRIYLAQTWTHDAPSTGIISVFDADLHALAPIDLSHIRVPRLNSPATDPPALNMVAVAPDGNLLIATGAILAQLWGVQSAGIYFVDPDSHQVVDATRLSGWLSSLEIVIP